MAKGKVWEEEELEFLKENLRTMSMSEIGEKLGRSYRSILNKARREGLTRTFYWSQEDINFLEDHVGSYSFTYIAEKLGRTVVAVENMARKVGLGNPRAVAGYFSLVRVADILSLDPMVLIRWIDKYDFPAQKKSLTRQRTSSSKQYRYSIDPEEFWKWAEKHKHLINFSKMEDGVLLPEPNWVSRQRFIDAQTIPKRARERWTDYEVMKLKQYMDLGWTAKEMAKALNRTEKACSSKATALKKEREPVKS